jgi:ATP synthase protein I
MAKPSERSSRDAGSRLQESLFGPVSRLQASFNKAGSAATASYTLIGAIILLGAAGYFGDRWLGTGPWLLIIGLLLGVVVGFYELVRLAWRRTP